MNELYKDKGQAPGGMGAEKQPDHQTFLLLHIWK